MSTASNLLLEARSRASLGQAELARRAGIPRSVLNAYERRRREPGVAALARLLAAAGFRLELEAEPGLFDDRAGRILAHVLDLAEALPRRRRGVLTFPTQAQSRTSVLAERLVAIHEGLTAGGFPHAYGGAVALAYCANEARVTLDLAVHVFVERADAQRVLVALPNGVSTDPIGADVARPIRAWWDDVPFDMFFGADDFGRACASRVRSVPFVDTVIPVLDGACLVVHKAIVGRADEWVDIEAITQVGAFDVEFALHWIGCLFGADHPNAERLASLVS